jgi:hypothetical protein
VAGGQRDDMVAGQVGCYSALGARRLRCDRLPCSSLVCAAVAACRGGAAAFAAAFASAAVAGAALAAEATLGESHPTNSNSAALFSDASNATHWRCAGSIPLGHSLFRCK